MIGGLAMLGVFVYGLTTQAGQVSIVAGVLVAACVVVAVVVRQWSSAPYFAQRSEVHEIEAETEIRARPS